MLRFAITLVAALGLALPAMAQDTRSYTDDTGRAVDVPADPVRIVSLHDSSITTALLELGITPVGSFSRAGADGKPFMRGSQTLTGVNFENSPIVNIGGSPADIEAIARLEPDLIITASFNETPVEQLEAIAPTVVLEDNMRGEFVIFDTLAELTNTQDRLAILKNRYAGQIQQIKDVLAGQPVSASVMLVQSGQLAVWYSYGALGKVLRDAGITFPPLVEAIEGSDRVFFSAEQLPELDADFIFATYDISRGLTPQGALGEYEALLPGYCGFLHACREGQFILLPREDAVARSYTALGLMSSAVLASIGGRPFTPMPE